MILSSRRHTYYKKATSRWKSFSLKETDIRQRHYCGPWPGIFEISAYAPGILRLRSMGGAQPAGLWHPRQARARKSSAGSDSHSQGLSDHKLARLTLELLNGPAAHPLFPRWEAAAPVGHRPHHRRAVCGFLPLPKGQFLAGRLALGNDEPVFGLGEKWARSTGAGS